MAAARNISRKGRQRSQDPAESLINLSNERLTGLFRWTLLIFAVILNNLNAAPGYDEGRINGILAAWGVVCLTTVLLLFLHRLFLFVVVAVVGSVMAQAVSAHQELVTRRDVEAKLMTEVNMALANATQAKERYTRGHSERLAKLAGACADRMGLSRDESAAVRLGAILHDVGKIGIPDRILRQSMALTEDEMAWMRRHPQIGADIIGPVEGLHHVAPLIRHHHEKFDGTGYPKGLKGEDIPLGSRIISVADAFEAMVADRIYRPSLGLAKALEEIKTGRGGRLAPRVVDGFPDLIATDTVHLPLPTKDQGQKLVPNRPDEPVQTAA